VLEYFASQGEVAQKQLFNLPTKMNASTYLGKDGALLEFVKTLCGLLGYDLNPDSEEKDANMDDQISFLEAATWYLTHPKSPFQEHQPELFIYRDIVTMYKVRALAGGFAEASAFRSVSFCAHAHSLCAFSCLFYLSLNIDYDQPDGSSSQHQGASMEQGRHRAQVASQGSQQGSNLTRAAI
jgi:hypothetical protein